MVNCSPTEMSGGTPSQTSGGVIATQSLGSVPNTLISGTCDRVHVKVSACEPGAQIAVVVSAVGAAVISGTKQMTTTAAIACRNHLAPCHSPARLPSPTRMLMTATVAMGRTVAYHDDLRPRLS